MIITWYIINIFIKMDPQKDFVEDKDTYYLYEDKPITDEILEEMKKYTNKIVCYRN